MGTVLAGLTGTWDLMVEWDDWYGGHDGWACDTAVSCGSCEPEGDSRWMLFCDELDPYDPGVADGGLTTL